MRLLSIKNLLEKLNISYKRINSPNIKNEVNNQKAPILQQNNYQIKTQVNNYESARNPSEKEEETSGKDLTEQGYRQVIIGSDFPNVWNKLF